MKRFLSTTTAVFFFLMASAQKIEFKNAQVYIGDKKIEINNCKESDFNAQFGQPDFADRSSFMKLAYYKKGTEVFIEDAKKFSGIKIYFTSDEKMTSFPGELWLNGNRISSSTTGQELNKMKGLNITREVAGPYDTVFYEIETGDMTYRLTYKKGKFVSLLASI